MAIKVLLVEDDPLVRRMYERALTMSGFDLRTASDGTIVVESIVLNRPDIILMDVMMPNFNGLETLEELKTNHKTESIPVIMLSAYDDPEIVDKAIELGASRYLVKNAVEPLQVAAVINEVVGNPTPTHPAVA